jgi:hypothetical protein
MARGALPNRLLRFMSRGLEAVRHTTSLNTFWSARWVTTATASRLSQRLLSIHMSLAQKGLSAR